MTMLFDTADGRQIEDGDMCYWYSNAPGEEKKLERGCFSVEFRYGELFEIQLGYTNGGYSTRYSERDIATDVYVANPMDTETT